ncbi:MAG TPA: asparagine synthase (glutamine-hydrolyzing) [Elusimicrobia bacterium]|nr:asparagine synthase (glutamine-hydrolyzing) [Elusimicrobiota bacterium]HBT61454.1 asparagine synthase (glutamine-hydrolyzing) [Elusimicrobiota bacterium]
MCGIFGVFAQGGAPLDPDRVRGELQAAGEAIAHRGPDASGIVVRPRLGFGHRRLSILDLNVRSNQPMSSPDQSVLVTYNGEIYNFRELRSQLEGEGPGFSTTSDTEVLIRGYQRWGLAGLLARAAGMFAFALYDGTSGRLYLARDRAGKKPLYWAQGDGRIYFCSELQGLFKLWPGPRRLNPQGLESYLALKFVPAPGTLFDGVNKVPPGHYLEFGPEGQTRCVEYWNPLVKRGGGPAQGQALEMVERALDLAVRRRLVSDVPVCVFLSGGIDSSLIVDRIAAAGARGTAAYTVGYGDMPGYNEFEYARLVARKYPVDHREINISSREVLGVLQDDAMVLDDPISDWVWVPLHFLSRRARADGFKVVLLGEGADEIFVGYDVMLKGLSQLERFSKPGWQALARCAYALGRPLYALTHRGHRRFDLLRRAARDLPVYWGSSIGFPATQRHQIAGPALVETGRDPAGEFIAGLYRRYAQAAADPSDLLNLVSFIEFYTKMGEVLLHRVDRVSMRHSLEARAPFLDHELCELAFSLPGNVKCPGRRLKGLLKEIALKRLPSEVVTRPKMGFSFPFKEWLRGPLAPAVQSVFADSGLFRDGWLDGAFCRALLREHQQGRADHASRLWMIYSLARWYDRWLP